MTRPRRSRAPRLEELLSLELLVADAPKEEPEAVATAPRAFTNIDRLFFLSSPKASPSLLPFSWNSIWHSRYRRSLCLPGLRAAYFP